MESWGRNSGLREVDPTLRVWIGGLAEGTSKEDVENHFSSIGQCTFVSLLGKNTAAVAYNTTSEVETAISSLNGSALCGGKIEVDTWTVKPKTDGEGKGKGKYGGAGGVWQPMMQKPWGLVPKGAVAKGWGKEWSPLWAKGFGKGDWGMGGKGKGKNNWKMFEIDNSLKVWVGNLNEEIRWKEVQEFFKQAGETQWVEKRGKEVACVAFKDEASVQAALALTGSDINGATIEVDVWTAKPKTEEN